MRYLSDKEVDHYTSPDFWRKMLPNGRVERDLDYLKDMRQAGVWELSKVEKKAVDGWEYIGSIPPYMAWALMQCYTPEQMAADEGKVVKDWLRRNEFARVTERKL